jgi:hypothetical protein
MHAHPSTNGFETFWAAYPRKQGKLAAQRKWTQLRPPLDQCLQAIAEQRSTEQWLKDRGAFIPYPATWLHQGRWMDVTKVELGRRYRQQSVSAVPADVYDKPISLEQQAEYAKQLAELRKSHGCDRGA